MTTPLRKLANEAASFELPVFSQALHDAADEIERLRKLAWMLVHHWDEFGPTHGYDEQIHIVKTELSSNEQP